MTLTTQQRILQTSAKLFNKHGVEAVSIGQISELLAISPGNFTYHYKKKADLIRHHFNLLEEGLYAIVDRFPVRASPKVFSRALFDLVELVFNYRFLFLGASFLIKNELVSGSRYRRLVEHTRRSVVGHISTLIAEGTLAPIAPPYSVETLVDSIWWQWLGWLLSMQVMPPGKISSRKLVTDALINIVLFNHHYVDEVFFRAVRLEIGRIGQRSSRKSIQPA
jgi:AcrR family transcriptional regulator